MIRSTARDGSGSPLARVGRFLPRWSVSRSRARPFGGDRGNVTLIAALVIPVISVAVAGAVELGELWKGKDQLQSAADAAALSAANELILAADSGVIERAKALALMQTRSAAESGSVTADAAISADGKAVSVDIVANRPSFFGDLLSRGGFTTRVSSTAVAVGSTPLCILVNGGKGGQKVLNLIGQAKLTARGCLVHSNKDIAVEDLARLDAGSVQSVRSTNGLVSPAAEVGAEPIRDPFGGHQLGASGPCQDLSDRVLTAGIHNLKAGRHCQTITVEESANLRLGAGEHYFDNADLIMKANSTLHGKDVVLIFNRYSNFAFTDSTTIDLFGRKRGAFAGFLIATTRDNTSDFIMWSNNIRTLLGVVYIPEATLIVQGTDQMAEQSAWTVIVAERLLMKGSPTLVINKDYAATDVPVPSGVGITKATSRLVE